MKFDYKEFCSYSIGKPTTIDKPVNYVLCGNGAKEIRQNEIGIFVVSTNKVAGLEPLPEGFTMKLPKIPLSILFQIIGFFKAVNEKYRAEAIVQIYWDRENKKYFCNCPKQLVTGASVNFKREPEFDRKYLLIADVHSHSEMKPFFSGTDDNDEKETRLFGVVGNITEDLPDVKFRAVAGHNSVEVPLHEIFDFSLNFPKSWLKQIKIKKEIFTHKHLEQGTLWDEEQLKRCNANCAIQSDNPLFQGQKLGIEEIMLIAQQNLELDEVEELAYLLMEFKQNIEDRWFLKKDQSDIADL